MNKKRIIFFLIVILSACTSIQKKEFLTSDGYNVIQEWYNKSTLKSQTTFLSQDSSEYIFVSYSEDGKLMDSCRYKNNIADGLRKYYDKSAGLMHFEYYANGFLNGPNMALYQDGVSNYEGYLVNENKAGEWKFHYPDGRLITYEFYDSTGKVLYFRRYNELGAFSSCKGNPIIGATMTRSESSRDTYRMQFVVSNPPGCKIRLIVAGTNLTTYSDRQVDNVNIEFPLILAKEGNIELDIQMEIIDNQSGHTEKYSKRIEFALN